MAMRSLGFHMEVQDPKGICLWVLGIHYMWRGDFCSTKVRFKGLMMQATEVD